MRAVYAIASMVLAIVLFGCEAQNEDVAFPDFDGDAGPRGGGEAGAGGDILPPDNQTQGGSGGDAAAGSGGSAGSDGEDGAAGSGGGNGGGNGGGGPGGGGPGGGPGGAGGGTGGAGNLPAQGEVGAPCENNEDCGDGMECLPEADGFQDGYCLKKECEQNGCPEGSTCFGLAAGGSACFDNCADSSECRAGYICDADDTCYPGGAGPGDGEVGGPCDTDDDCGGGTAQCIPEQEGEFIDGFCITPGCSQDNPCPDASDCFQINDDGSTACLPTCANNDACRAGYACQDPGVCMPGCTAGSCPDGMLCGDDGVCEDGPCQPGECPNGMVCGDAGRCIIDLGDAPPGPVPNCANGPDFECDGNEAFCGAIIAFEPDEGPGYWDYPINGETNNDEYRSYSRRDLQLLIKYAAARVDCLTAGWDFGNGAPIGLGDMSEQNGAIPGTREGDPGHPAGTHVNGHDTDIGYFQTQFDDNRLRPICDHVQGGQDQYHCVSEPDNLDVWRTALFLIFMHDSRQFRVVGIDGRAGVLVESAMDQLCDSGWVPANSTACVANRRALAYEVEDTGRGWYLFHHHHLHVSIVDRPTAGLGNIFMNPVFGPNACLTVDCAPYDSSLDPRVVIAPEPRAPWGLPVDFESFR